MNISSSTALTGGAGGAHDAAAKAGIDGLTRHLTQELAPAIRVNSAQPRSIETEGFHAFIDARFDDPAAMAAAVQSTSFIRGADVTVKPSSS